MSRSAWILVLCLAGSAACGPAADTPPAAADTAGRAVYGTTPAAPPAAAAISEQPETPPLPSVAFGARTLAYPDGLQMILLGYRLRGENPPLQTWAGAPFEVRHANEFEKPALLAAELSRLRAIYATVADIGILKLRTKGRFSEYDPVRGGYYLDAFSAGRFFKFEDRGESLTLQLANGSDASFWPLDPAAARAVLAQAPTRQLSIDMTVALTGYERRASGPVVTGRLIDYGLTSDGGPHEVPFGRFSLADVSD